MPNDILGTTIPPGSLLVPSGRPGAQGWSANSLITAAFTIPAVGDTVDVEFVNTAWLTIGSVIFVGGMFGRVMSISGNTVTLGRIEGGGEATGGGDGGGIPEAPGPPSVYGRQSGFWLPTLPISGGTVTGPLTVNGAASLTSTLNVGTNLGVGGAVSFSTTLNVANNVTLGSDLAVTGNQTLNGGLTVGTSSRFASLVTTDFTAFRRADIGARVYQYAGNWFMQWRESDGQISWGNGSGVSNQASLASGIFGVAQVDISGWGIAYVNWTADRIGIFRQAGVGYHLVLNGASAGMISLTPSDERLKDNTAPATEDTLAVLRGVETYSFDQRDTGDYDYSQHADVGFVAQRLREQIPEAVVASPRVPNRKNHHNFTDDEALLSISPLPLIARCVRGLQQLADKLDALEERIDGRSQSDSANNGTLPRGRSRRAGD